jgi:hypothetical protein
LSTVQDTLFHATVLSNFARAWDKYGRAWDKRAIAESRYPDEFYVLRESELSVGAAKARRLREKLGLCGDALIALETSLPKDELRAHPRNGPGRVWPSRRLPLLGLRQLSDDGRLGPRVSFEDAMAASLALNARSFTPWSALRPRSISILPIARGCQAACPFCFSEASASAEQEQAPLDDALVDRWLDAAQARGAERAVITGGGEPTLVRWPALLSLVSRCRARFRTVVLITNGFVLSGGDAGDRLRALHAAGLTVLAVSRHHPDEAVNAKLMNLSNRTPALAAAWRSFRGELTGMRLRLVCVLQANGVASVEDVDAYVRWAAESGADEVCFKELYVSTSRESVYHSHAANQFSAEHQVPLARVLGWAEQAKWERKLELPWGAPVFEGEMRGRRLRVAAYTEPSVFWERTHGLARSWNLMADGTCLASLEDRKSELHTPSTPFTPRSRACRGTRGVSFEQFLTWSAEVRRENPSAVALCETRIHKALADLQPKLAVPSPVPKIHRCHLARDFCALRGLPEGADKRALVCEGVRHGLSLWFAALAKEGRSVALPRDVYPVYGVLARAAGVTTVPVDTFPEPSLPQLFGESGAVLAPFPWKLHGRAWNRGEVDAALAWLKADPSRRLALDGVYGFGAPATPELLELLATGQVLLFDSLSKGFLHAQVFGVALVPEQDFAALAVSFRAASPSPEKLWMAAQLIASGQATPGAVEARLAELRAAAVASLTRLELEHEPVGRGYLIPVRASAEEALRRGALTLPLSVFGGTAGDWSIASALPG